MSSVPGARTLLVVDDDPLILQCMKLCLPEPDYHVLVADSAERGLEAFRSHRPDAVLLDVQLPDRSGLAAVHDFHELDRRVPVIVMTGHGSAEVAITAMSGGAFEYVTKPFEPDEILPLIDSALETSQMARRPAVLPTQTLDQPPESADRMLGDCPAMVDVFRQIGRVASRDVAVLILGETGTGKEVVARAIFQHSRRFDQTFHAINCAAIPETLLESELFGHEKGSFTGADQRRIGKFEICHRGTLFLDEIGEMSPIMQTKLLRVLQEKEFERVGGSTPIKTDVRIIAATNRDLEAAITEGSFRSDLFYRLNEFTIRLPPLRERGDDIGRMAEYFFAVYARTLGKDFVAIADETMRRLLAHRWPGNVRELQGIVKQTLLKASGPVIVPAFLPTGFAGGDPAAPEPGPTADWHKPLGEEIAARLNDGSHNLSDEIHAAVDLLLIQTVLKATGGNLSETSLRLGVSRPTLRNRMKQLGLDRPA
ncbi:sigma-54-dependent Fis family transcriptional regulator [Roseiconus nitratireducens]|uniref:DNA-binding transcriptional regulator NtrC n=1 Tax=Roseiconus nitratireducens TaxID=2605748 RepID=A0A5M6D2P1_9BACT|nr:sigma-54 dependent transcriptional regulator [Roseiconus nitratireducens]KAA5541777.1 sigma-54-dependent Fis family transcriptional regulator [Roseiconus nitratireducens]